MELAIQILHVLVCVFLVLTILLQAGKGASIGAAFGGAGSQTVFGGRGAQTFLSKLTTTAAAIFFLTSLTLSHLSGGEGRSVVQGEHAPVTAPAAADVAAPDAAPAAEQQPAEAAPAAPAPDAQQAPAAE
ncbi:preprotein translocase subunit SecG [Vulgatibacter incomptus]|uniref:Protein-export membrane protein SecG n=1 Tax=Vulgatibacter incomptus TaxID=1391653 RepID=A0A0K1PAM5_9BACT|nr:preprotein translocase subunit SecG [Vulgatibacter incomptus]AKU90466.1 Preprotein translocase subunit SecG [Vulgatibacter incomptus]